jgi:hypothetical protein
VQVQTLKNVRSLLDQLGTISGRVGSVRDLLGQQRTELDRLQKAAADLHHSDGPSASAAAAAEDADGLDESDPIVAQALAIGERVKQRTMADVQRNIELLESMSAAPGNAAAAAAAGNDAADVDIDRYRCAHARAHTSRVVIRFICADDCAAVTLCDCCCCAQCSTE